MLAPTEPRCPGHPAPVRPSHPLGICIDCARRGPPTQTSGRMHPPAKHDGHVWTCEARIVLADATTGS